ncbi:hypothetical protein AADZ90_002810 [Aestuariibius sp. 2305UL40-4]|uniref:hypothetical protein n=1 Tax=Aestuariibius violaceus TaxID=3234132 RepID=UPI00345EBE83
MASRPVSNVLGGASLALLTACAPTPSAEDTLDLAARANDIELTQTLAGRTIVSENTRYEIGEDGILSGTSDGLAVFATWTIENGAWCRNVIEPDLLAGRECQSLFLTSDTMTVTRENGQIVTYSFE